MDREVLRPLVLIFLVSALIASFAAMRFSEHPSLHWDAAHYALLARNLVEGNGFSNGPGHPTAFRPPLYPTVVSLVFRAVGERYRAVYLLQAVLYALAVTGSALLAYRIAGRRSMLLTGILASVNPSALGLTGLLLTETLFTFLLVCSLLLLNGAFHRYSTKVLSPGRSSLRRRRSSLWGRATLCRPNRGSMEAFWSGADATPFLRRKGSVRYPPCLRCCPPYHGGDSSGSMDDEKPGAVRLALHCHHGGAELLGFQTQGPCRFLIHRNSP